MAYQARRSGGFHVRRWGLMSSTCEHLEDYVTEVLAGWPPLTDGQLDRIAALLRAGSRRGPKNQPERPSGRRNRQSPGNPAGQGTGPGRDYGIPPGQANHTTQRHTGKQPATQTRLEEELSDAQSI